MGSLVKSCLAWPEAALVLARWLADRERVDTLMEGLPPEMDPVERARCQHLVFGVVRHAGRIEAGLTRLVAHPPRFVTRAALCLLGFELIEAQADESDAGRAAPIVHHAVEQTKSLASPAEARLVNAVGRRLAEGLAAQRAPGKVASAEALAEYFSHPAWLVKRWLTAFGAASTRALLEWNQSPAPVYARARTELNPLPSWLRPTKWAGFFAVEGRHWAEVEAEIARGALYIQDPGTRLAVDVLQPKPGETWLDACAAPGGKSLLLCDRAGTGRLIAGDLGGDAPEEKRRFGRLTANLATVHGVKTHAVRLDLLARPEETLRRADLPERFAAVLVDVPCSNTGVMRHRIDVKWRLQAGDFAKHARQQRALLAAAARLVEPGGRLVYSTCSIDPEENEEVASRFLRENPEFVLAERILARPADDGHDGAGVFRFTPLRAPGR